MANESRLIDANELVSKINKLEVFYFTGETDVQIHDCQMVELGSVLSEIDDAHPVDAVEVTRCKHCQEFAPGFIRPYLGWCSVWDTTVREAGFCHHGKPRSEETPKPAWPQQEEMEEPCED